MRVGTHEATHLYFYISENKVFNVKNLLHATRFATGIGYLGSISQ